MIDKVVRGFWNHPIHIQKLFEYLTKVPSLLENIQHGLTRQTELMERYLLRQDKKGEFYFHLSKQQTIITKLNRRQDQRPDDPAPGYVHDRL